jgi:hypothetical protein
MHFTHHITLIYFQRRNYSLYSFVIQKDRFPEISFSVHQNAENAHKETLIK